MAEKKEKKEASPRRVFVEVGTHQMPVPLLGSRKFEENDVYIGIDIKKHRVKEARRRVERLRPENRKARFISADAEHLPLKDSSVDELYFGNVLGVPSISEEDRIKFLDEAERVLRKEGRLIIKETNTPLAVDDLRELLEGRSLEQEKFLTPKDKDWNEEVELYHRGAAKTEPWWRMYLAIFRKNEQK